MQRLLVVVASSVVAVTLVGACGSDSKKTIAKSEYISKADEICKKYNDQGDKLAAPDSNASDPQIEDFIHQGVTLQLKGISELRALPNPDKDAAKFKALYDKVEQRFKDLDAKSASEVKTLPDTYFDDLNNEAKALGLQECAKTD